MREQGRLELVVCKGIIFFQRDIKGEFFVAGKWCPRREWSSASDARVASDAARRGVLYSSVFLGSPGKYRAKQKKYIRFPLSTASELIKELSVPFPSQYPLMRTMYCGSIESQAEK